MGKKKDSYNSMHSFAEENPFIISIMLSEIGRVMSQKRIKICCTKHKQSLVVQGSVVLICNLCLFMCQIRKIAKGNHQSSTLFPEKKTPLGGPTRWKNTEACLQNVQVSSCSLLSPLYLNHRTPNYQTYPAPSISSVNPRVFHGRWPLAELPTSGLIPSGAVRCSNHLFAFISL